MAKNDTIDIPALKVRQWLNDWNDVEFSKKNFRRKPQPWFYQFSIPATYLKALSGIYPRTTKERKSGTEDLGIQRRHEPERSDKIREFVRFGYPWSDLSQAKRKAGEFSELRKPGWLPTAIVVNILGPEDERFGKKVSKKDIINLRFEGENLSFVQLPKTFHDQKWRAESLPPIEVIDGQHRLWAFEKDEFPGDFEFPVVAFHELDISWQAYLFYTINIKPKKINASLAFDLYPLLRTEDWLEKFEGHVIYRETRAQELVDTLWGHPESPWHKRINMLGEAGLKGVMVTQSAWIRSLLATFVKSWESPRSKIGGLFGTKVGTNQLTLPWGRTEQAAFLITAGQCLERAVTDCNEVWAKKLRAKSDKVDKYDAALFGPNSLLNQDQGIRTFLHLTNDLCYVNSDHLDLASWGKRSNDEANPDELVANAVASLKKEKVHKFLTEAAKEIATYDWRASSTPGLTEQESLLKAAFRGSGGYRDLRRQVLKHIVKRDGPISKSAQEVLSLLGLD